MKILDCLDHGKKYLVTLNSDLDLNSIAGLYYLGYSSNLLRLTGEIRSDNGVYLELYCDTKLLYNRSSDQKGENRNIRVTSWDSLEFPQNGPDKSRSIWYVSTTPE